MKDVSEKIEIATKFLEKHGYSIKKSTKTFNAPKGYLREPSVKELTGLSSASIWRYASTGAFPQPVKFSERMTCWKEADVLNWIKSKEVMA